MSPSTNFFSPFRAILFRRPRLATILAALLCSLAFWVLLAKPLFLSVIARVYPAPRSILLVSTNGKGEVNALAVAYTNSGSHPRLEMLDPARDINGKNLGSYYRGGVQRLKAEVQNVAIDGIDNYVVFSLGDVPELDKTGLPLPQDEAGAPLDVRKWEALFEAFRAKYHQPQRILWLADVAKTARQRSDTDLSEDQMTGVLFALLLKKFSMLHPPMAEQIAEDERIRNPPSSDPKTS